MKVVLAADSYKECLSAREVCEAMASGIRAILPETEIVTVPMADGGDGTLEVVLAAGAGQRLTRRVTGPLGSPVDAAFALVDGGETALIEAAAANGLALVPPASRNPLTATTRGVGELLLAAAEAGAGRVILTIGGSATVDGGTGLARALGYRFLDEAGAELPEGGGSLTRLARIVPPAEQPWRRLRIEVACDVDSPLIGELGAARLFGPQKGASPAQVEQLEAGLRRLGERLAAAGHDGILEWPGGGAAGGLGAGLVAFAGARLRPGVDLVLDLVGLANHLADADLVLTGEGHTDAQTLRGKVIAGVARLARQAGVPCVAISGGVTAGLAELRPLGVTAAFSICRRPLTLAAAMAEAPRLVAEAAANAVSLAAVRRPKG